MKRRTSYRGKNKRNGKRDAVKSIDISYSDRELVEGTRDLVEGIHNKVDIIIGKVIFFIIPVLIIFRFRAVH